MRAGTTGQLSTSRTLIAVALDSFPKFPQRVRKRKNLLDPRCPSFQCKDQLWLPAPNLKIGSE